MEEFIKIFSNDGILKYSAIGLAVILVIIIFLKAIKKQNEINPITAPTIQNKTAPGTALLGNSSAINTNTRTRQVNYKASKRTIARIIIIFVIISTIPNIFNFIISQFTNDRLAEEIPAYLEMNGQKLIVPDFLSGEPDASQITGETAYIYNKNQQGEEESFVLLAIKNNTGYKIFYVNSKAFMVYESDAPKIFKSYLVSRNTSKTITIDGENRGTRNFDAQFIADAYAEDTEEEQIPISLIVRNIEIACKSKDEYFNNTFYFVQTADNSYLINREEAQKIKDYQGGTDEEKFINAKILSPEINITLRNLN